MPSPWKVRNNVKNAGFIIFLSMPPSVHIHAFRMHACQVEDARLLESPFFRKYFIKNAEIEHECLDILTHYNSGSIVSR